MHFSMCYLKIGFRCTSDHLHSRKRIIFLINVELSEIWAQRPIYMSIMTWKTAILSSFSRMGFMIMSSTKILFIVSRTNYMVDS